MASGPSYNQERDMMPSPLQSFEETYFSFVDYSVPLAECPKKLVVLNEGPRTREGSATGPEC